MSFVRNVTLQLILKTKYLVNLYKQTITNTWQYTKKFGQITICSEMCKVMKDIYTSALWIIGANSKALTINFLIVGVV